LPRELHDLAAQPAVTVTQGEQQVVRIEMAVGKQTLADIEHALIEEILRLSGYNKSLAAKHLGLTRFALDRRLKKIDEEERAGGEG
jgi:two-component system response regulator AtoC